MSKDHSKAYFKAHIRDARRLSRQMRRQRLKTTGKVVAAPVKYSWRWRDGLAPAFAGLGGYSAGSLAFVLPDGDKTLLVLLALTGVGVWKSIGRPNQPKSHMDMHTHWGAWTAWAIWAGLIEATALTGPGVPMPGLFLVWMLGVGVAWWTKHYRRRNIATTSAVPKDTRISTWDTFIAKQGGAAPGSEIIDLTEITPGVFGDDNAGPVIGDRKGWSAHVALPGADFPAKRLMAEEARSRIAGAFAVATNDVVVEEGRGGRQDRATVTVMSRTATDAIAAYGADWHVVKDGCVPFSIHPDGQIGWTQVWLPGSGPVHELYSGDSGAGKSRGMELAITQSAATGLVVPMVADPQEGASFPAWAGIDGAAIWAAGDMDEIEVQISALEHAMNVRGRFMSQVEWKSKSGKTRRGLGEWDAEYMMTEHGMPILEYTLDEAPDVLADADQADRMERIARKARKCGIKLRLGTQYPAQDQLGNRVAIRQQLVGGNIISFRTGIRGGKDLLLPSFLPDPYDIPKVIEGAHTKGMCVLYSAAPGGARAAYSRAAYLDKDAAFDWADEFKERIPDLDPLTAGALGVDVAAWRRRLDGDRDAEVVTSREVITVADITNAADNQTAPIATRKPSKKEQILAYLHDTENARTGQIASALDIALPTVTQTLKRLADKGHVHDDGHARWSVRKPDAELETTNA